MPPSPPELVTSIANDRIPNFFNPADALCRRRCRLRNITPHGSGLTCACLASYSIDKLLWLMWLIGVRGSQPGLREQLCPAPCAGFKRRPADQDEAGFEALLHLQLQVVVPLLSSQRYLCFALSLHRSGTFLYIRPRCHTFWVC